MDNQQVFSEKSDAQKFWLTLIRDTFGIINPEDYIDFEKRVLIDGRTKFIDAYIPSTGVIIEQKSPGKDLHDAFVQAKNYHDWLPLSERGRQIITCDFFTLHIHDMEQPAEEPLIINVDKVSKDNLSFLLTPGETRPLEEIISVKAGATVDKLYKHLTAQLLQSAQENNYTKNEYNKKLDDINVFLVRLVFLLYAEDAGLFSKYQFHDYLKTRPKMEKEAVTKLFTILDIPQPERYKYHADPEEKAFPYVNGGLFHETIEVPYLDEDAVDIIISEMSEKTDWKGISPTVFGAVFESTLNKHDRKQAGIHYTSPANIHKLIDPLFLDELTQTLNDILNLPQSHERTQKLLAFQDKLSRLKFLDPACGSGNFLTESFISIRRLENKAISAIPQEERPSVKVSITQFHGIEAHDFAVNIARTALWISDHQMWQESQKIAGPHKSPLPLVDYHHIKEGSAMDELPNEGWKLGGWKIPHDDMLYIMGNPPFLGRAKQDEKQKQDVRDAFGGKGVVDYVACWFAKAFEYVSADINTKAAFVATNSVVQGEQIGYIFRHLRRRWENVKIDFAHQSFVWKNELPDPKKMAHVHVVIIGMSTRPPELRKLYTPEGLRLVKNINFYLEEGPDDDIAEERETPVCENAPFIRMGNMPADQGKLIIKAEDYPEFIRREPGAKRFIKRFMMGDEFISNKMRYCLWLVNAGPQDIKDMPLVYRRVKECKEIRLKSSQPQLADTPHLFREQMNPSRYIAIPKTSSEKREYIPIAYLDASVIPGDSLRIIPEATLYHFGVLTSRVHMAWMRRVTGRMKSDYSYSKNVVYNTFAWPSPTPKQLRLIEHTAQNILDARASHPHTSLAALYDSVTMPADLRTAHAGNDKAVCSAYGWPEDITENGIVDGLFRLYHKLTGR